MLCKRISTQASPVVKFPTCKLQISSKNKHGTQTHPSMGNDRREVPITVAEPQACKLQQDQQANKNNNNMQTRNQWTIKDQASTNELVLPLKNNIAHILCIEHCIKQTNKGKYIVTGLLSKNLRLWVLLGKHLSLSGAPKGLVLCKHLIKNVVWKVYYVRKIIIILFYIIIK